MPALKTLERFPQRTVHIAALVIDEYGGVLGLVSEKDLLEALVGDLPDRRPGEERIAGRADGSFLVDGSLPVEDLKTLLHVNELPGYRTGRFQTVAGLVLDNLRKIPQKPTGSRGRGIDLKWWIWMETGSTRCLLSPVQGANPVQPTKRLNQGSEYQTSVLRLAFIALRASSAWRMQKQREDRT